MRNALAALALAPLLLAGCTDDEPTDDPTPKMPSTSSTTTSEPTSTEPTEPTAPPEIEGTDAKSAEAFVRYFFEVVNYAQATGDTAQLESLAQPACTSCASSARFIKETYEGGGRIEGGAFTASNIRADLTGTGAAHASARTSNPPQKIIAKDGSVSRSTRATKNAWEFQLRVVRGKWSLVTTEVR